jgi:hypothetical protein
MLFSDGNKLAFLGCVAAGVLLSIPFGFGVGLLPVIGFAAGDTIAAMFIPYTEKFRDKVDKKYRVQVREATRSHLLEEINQRDQLAWGKHGSFDAYQRMRDRVEALYKVAYDNRTQLSARDVEKLDDATLDYLRLWLASLVIEERARSVVVKEIEEKLQLIERDLKDAKPGTDQMQLQKARNEYLSLITRNRRMLSRKMAIEAAILSMPDQMDEIYQTIVTAPTSAEVDSKLAESIAKLGLEEDLEAELEGALRETVPESSVRPAGQSMNLKKVAALRQTEKS